MDDALASDEHPVVFWMMIIFPEVKNVYKETINI